MQGKYYRPPTRFGAAIRGVRARQRQYLISLPVAPPLTIVGGGISITGSGENALTNASARAIKGRSSARAIGFPMSSAADTKSLITGIRITSRLGGLRFEHAQGLLGRPCTE